MITEQYVSFETAKLLKEKGFENSSDLYYQQLADGKVRTIKIPYDSNFNLIGCIPAITQSLAMRWLREVHKMYLNIDYIPEHFCFLVKIIYKGEEQKFAIYKNSYEEAVETAIKYCLRNLID